MDYEALIASMFTYHAPTPEQVAAINDLRSSVKVTARLFDALTPDGPAKTLALRKLHEFSMAANYALVEGK